ncbi:MAG: Crp/Fnr family transcriptional regulator [Bacteroidota bacterium]|nr:Crp/Fnr family transcriptional regulator [Bacteroidota bacterium]
MSYEPILQNVARHIALDDAETDLFTSLLQPERRAKKELILHEGQVCKNIHYVHSGTLRAYYVDREGKESTIMFAIADWWITDMYCFINRLPAMLFIEAVEDSVIVRLNKEDLDRLYAEVPKFERFFRIIMQNAYIREQLRVIQNLSQPAKQRYEHFLEKYPQIAGKVTQKLIASYLGITPEFLSNIRGRKGKIS